MDWVRQWLRDYRFSPLHLPFFLSLSLFFSPPFSTEKQNTFVFSGSAVKILSWALARCLLTCSQGKSHETSVAKCRLIHMITIRLRDSTTPTADLLLHFLFAVYMFLVQILAKLYIWRFHHIGLFSSSLQNSRMDAFSKSFLTKRKI